MSYLNKTNRDFLEELSSSMPAPGGGGAAAAVGANAMALGIMVTNLTIGKKKYEDVEPQMKRIQKKLIEIREELAKLVDEDALGFEPLAKAYRMPQGTKQEIEQKKEVMEEALYTACLAPICMMECILKGMEEFSFLAEHGSRLAVSDVGVGIGFAFSALEGASYNILINAGMMKDHQRAEELRKRVFTELEQARELYEKIKQIVREKI